MTFLACGLSRFHEVWVHPHHEEWRLDTQAIGKRVFIYDRVESTNDLALGLASDPDNHGVVILTQEQTGGRGRQGRSWHAPRGSSVLLSLVVFPAAAKPTMLTAWAAVSVCETIRQTTDLQPAIKWPNDVLVEGKKVAGILLEQRHGVVVGIGLNVNLPEVYFQQAGLPQAASLLNLTGREWDWQDLARNLIGQLDLEFGEMGSRSLLSRWRDYLGLDDCQVNVECLDQTHEGKLVSIDWEKILLANDLGVEQLQPELVQHIWQMAR